MPPETNTAGPAEWPEQAWIHLTEPHEVEAWIAQCNQDLLQFDKNQAQGCGVCFSLELGGEIYMHSADDAVLLDVTPEANWVAKLITAATGVDAPRGQLWVLPADKLIQLLMGLSSLIATTRIVPSRRYKTHKL